MKKQFKKLMVGLLLGSVMFAGCGKPYFSKNSNVSKAGQKLIVKAIDDFDTMSEGSYDVIIDELENLNEEEIKKGKKVFRKLYIDSKVKMGEDEQLAGEYFDFICRKTLNELTEEDKKKLEKEEKEYQKNVKKVEKEKSSNKRSMSQQLQDKIQGMVNSTIVKDSNKKATIEYVSVSENVNNSGTYLAHVHMQVDVKNTPKMLNKLLHCYSNDLCKAMLQRNINNVSDVVVYWDDVYGGNSFKYEYKYDNGKYVECN